MKRLPIVQGLAMRSINMGEMMGDTKGTDAMVARLLLAAVPVLEAAEVFTKTNNDVSAANLQACLREFDDKAGQIFEECQ